MQQQQEEVVYLYLDDIIPNRFQPREVFDERPLKELAVSIKEHGVIQPIIVRKVNDKYEIIAGERRYKASALAGLTKIPAIIRNLDDKETSKVALLENLQRKNLNPLEEARTYQKILEIDEMTQEELAKTMGKSQSAVANKLRLLALPEIVQDALLKEKISERHARTLLNVEDPEKQKELLNDVIENKVSVRQLEEKIKSLKNPQPEFIEEPQLLETPQDSKNIENNFVSDTPLFPSFGENGEGSTENNSEPMLIVPPTTESNQNDNLIINNNENDQPANDTSEESKFINFGEIDDDEDGEEESEGENLISFGDNSTSAASPIDLNELKENSKDIGSLTNNDEGGADLDNLLKIGSNPVSSTTSNEQNSLQFFSPAQEALQESEKSNLEKSDDYFGAPDLLNINLPGETPTYNTNNVPLGDTFNVNLQNNDNSLKLENNNLQSAIDLIKETVGKIESSGIKVTKDEMNMENSYQIIIKLDK